MTILCSTFLIIYFFIIMDRTIKTFAWTDDNAALFVQYARLQKLVSMSGQKPRHCVEFINSFANASAKDISTLVKRVGKNNQLKDADVTDVTTLAEDSCLFSTSGDAASALNIVLTYLKALNTGGRIPALWCYLDDDKRAVVHFVNRKGYYAELYCLVPDFPSALHLIDDDNRTFLVACVFTDQFSTDLIKKVDEAGGCCLHDYLPREKFALLSKSGRKNNGKKSYAHMHQTKEATSYDSGDTL